MGLSARQKLALNRSTAPVNLWYGSVRSSKTYAQQWDFISRMTQYDGTGTQLVIGYSMSTIWRNFFRPIFEKPEFKAIAPHLKYYNLSSAGTLFGYPFSVVGANGESSWIGIQGMTVKDAWGDEATSWPESFWDMLGTRLSLPNSRLLATCNPGTANHYLKKKVVDAAESSPYYHVEKFLLHENPTLPAD